MTDRDTLNDLDERANGVSPMHLDQHLAEIRTSGTAVPDRHTPPASEPGDLAGRGDDGF